MRTATDYWLAIKEAGGKVAEVSRCNYWRVARAWQYVFYGVWFWFSPRRTCTAAQSGDIDDLRTWMDGLVPRRWDKVVVGPYRVECNRLVKTGNVTAWEQGILWCYKGATIRGHIVNLNEVPFACRIQT